MTKKEIRTYYLEKRKEITEEKLEHISISIANQFFKQFDLSLVEYLHVFIPIKKIKEVNTWHIINRIWKEYPHINIATSITFKDKLEHCLIDGDTIFIDDKWGIPTPQNTQKISAEKIDLVITPLLAFDENLNRVGYGKGYYDKFFSECKSDVQKIGVSLFPSLDKKIDDTDKYDIALDEVVSIQ